MKRRSFSALTIVVVALLAGGAAAQDLRVAYTGELIDGTGRPLAGVFDLEFKLFETEQAEEALWAERHFLAVQDGEYTVQLGNATAIDPELMGRELVLVAEFMGQEVLRETLTLEASSPEDEDAALLAELGDLTQVTFADLADRAITADSAERAVECDTLGGLTVEDLDRYDELIDRIEELEERLSSQNTGGGSVQIGSSTTVLQRIGGEGGNRYTRMCPAGYVVVGVRGGAGGFIDSMEFVCAPIE